MVADTYEERKQVMLLKYNNYKSKAPMLGAYFISNYLGDYA